MKRSRAKSAPFKRLAALYTRMDQGYQTLAREVGFSCAGCPDNCCVSHFQHHTYVEWAYLWRGILALSEGDAEAKEKKERFLRRAGDNVRQTHALMAQGLRPRIMCPLNDEGLCGLYEHRLMICRLHGTAHTLAGPNRAAAGYPGCFRFEETVRGPGHIVQGPLPPEAVAPSLDRTPLYLELAAIEAEYLGSRLGALPKVDLTLSQMLVNGPPRLNHLLPKVGGHF